MTTISKLQVEWTGAGVVGGGVSTFYTAGTAGSLKAALNTLFGAMLGRFPANTSLVIPSSGEQLDSVTGAPVGVWTSGIPTVQTGTDPGAYAAGVGMRLVWQTSGVTGHRRVVGSTFLCPMGAGTFSADGTPIAAAITPMVTAVNTFVTALTPDFVIWHRPVGGVGGVIHAVTAGVVPDKVTWLRSRRT